MKTTKTQPESKFDVVDFIMAFEEGDLSEHELIAGFQRLIDDGTVNRLQGHYGRTAAALIERGYCQPKKTS